VQTETSQLTLQLLISDPSDRCSDHLPLLVLTGSTELRTNIQESSVLPPNWSEMVSVNIINDLLICTIFVSSSTSWIDWSFCDRTSKFSLDSDLRQTRKKQPFQQPINTRARITCFCWPEENPEKNSFQRENWRSETLTSEIWKQWHKLPKKAALILPSFRSRISPFHCSLLLVSITHTLLQSPHYTCFSPFAGIKGCAARWSWNISHSTAERNGKMQPSIELFCVQCAYTWNSRCAFFSSFRQAPPLFL